MLQPIFAGSDYIIYISEYIIQLVSDVLVLWIISRVYRIFGFLKKPNTNTNIRIRTRFDSSKYST